MKKTLIYACDEMFGIGKDGKIPWKCSQDLKHFKAVTSKGKKNAMLCGMKTFASMKDVSLEQRSLFCIGTNGDFSSIQEALEELSEYEHIFFIGGSEIYKQSQYIVDDMYITRIDGSYDCDVHFRPEFTLFTLEHSESFVNGTFYYYTSLHPDVQYKALCSKILLEGKEKEDRTGTGTLSIFGHHMKFHLTNYLPILTTKKVYTRAIIHELLWFLQGGIDSKELEEKKVNIWKGNTSREYLDSHNFHYETGETGPIYGFQWRHWNADYYGKNNEYYPDKYKDKGIDQIKQIIHTIKNNPSSRRIILSAWNPEQLSDMVLPPCHVMCQFYVNDGTLDCHMYQRSADVFLGLPFNITSYSILTCMIAHVCDLLPGNLYVSLGDAHIYKNHIEQIKIQRKRQHYPCPMLVLNSSVKDIDSFTFEDIQISDYLSQPVLKGEMAV